MKKNRFFARNKDVDVTRLRCMLGMLGLLLPWIVSILMLVFHGKFPESVSETFYYMATTAIFMIILGGASLFLIAYRGYELIDDILNTVAGIFGIGICLFPCGTDMYDEVGIFLLPQNVSNIIHCVCAIVFFAILSINSLFLFTKSNGEMTEKKKKRNVIFRICGAGMIVAFLPMPFILLGIIPGGLHATWIVEAVALFFFGISFVTKANVFKFLFAEDQKIQEEDKNIQKMENAKNSSSNCTKD